VIPLPFTCSHRRYIEGDANSHGNPIESWANGIPRQCFWWDPTSAEMPTPPTAGTRVTADRFLVLDASVSVDYRDKFTFDGGHEFQVQGLPKDYNHGPFGFKPNRLIIELKWVG